MNRKFTPQLALIAMLLFSFQVSTLTAQVGINTTAPAGGSMLDVDSANKGMLIPRLDIANLSTIAPVTGGSTTSLLAYNTNTTTGPGYVYWNGSIWVGIDGERDWKLAGNDNTNPGTTDGDDFIGTRDSNELIIATDQTEALRITTTQRLLAGNDGNSSNPEYSFGSDTDVGMYRSAANTLSFSTLGAERFSIEANGRLRSHVNGNLAEPAYTFETDPDTGFWRSTGSGDDNLNISAGGREMVEFNENGNSSEVVFNDTSEQTDFRVESNNDANMFFVDGTDNEIGIKTNDPQTELHIGGTSSVVRIDSFNQTNDANNNGVDVSAVYADANGNLTLEGPLTLNNMPEDNFATFVPAPAIIGDACGRFAQAAIYTTTITLTQDALIEVVYQIGVNLTTAALTPIADGDPRQYGTALFIDTNLVGYTSEAYTSFGTGQMCNGTFFLNGNGYAQLTGAPAGTTYTVTVFGFTFGADSGTGMCDGDSTAGHFGGNVGTDRFQLILHH